MIAVESAHRPPGSQARGGATPGVGQRRAQGAQRRRGQVSRAARRSRVIRDRRGIKRLARTRALHDSAVTVTSWGLRGARAVETGAERARLATADVVAEARERIGEQAPPPATGAVAHDHEH